MSIKNLLLNLKPKSVKKPAAKKDPEQSKFKGNAVRGYKPADNRQVTHNLRRRMGR